MGIRTRQFILFFGDAVLLYVSLMLTLMIRFGGAWYGDVLVSHAVAFSWLYGIWLTILYMFNLYDLSVIPRSVSFASRCVGALVILFLVGALFFYLLPFYVLTPKTNLLVHVGVFGVLMCGWRLMASRMWSSLFLARIGLFDPGGRMTDLSSALRAHHHAGYAVIPIPHVDGLARQIKELRLHAVIVDDSIENSPRLRQEFYACLDSEAYLMDSAEAYETFVYRIPLASVGPHWFIEQLHRGSHNSYTRLKRAFDVCAAALILLLSLPLWFCIALMITFDDHGPIFYSHERIGKHRKPFRIYKFRTMRRDAETNGAAWAQKNDPRTTRVGGILRRLHLDELPQMVNVLKGDMSLVGPRPERPDFVTMLETQIPHYHIRHFIDPGFTGWAQVRFRYARSVMDSKNKFEYDLYYVKNRSLLLDLLIIFESVKILLRHE